MKLKGYPQYKRSAVDWLGDVPEHWEVKPLFSLAYETKNKNIGMKEDNLLSLSYGFIVRKDIETDFGLLPESFDTYQIIDKNDIVLRLTDLQNDQKSLRVGYVNERGIITAAYVNLRCKNREDSKYIFYSFYNFDIQKIFYNYGGGVRQSMRFGDLKRLNFCYPPSSEQEVITKYLDRETSRIDELIVNKERLAELLKEKRTAIIIQAVTKGLNPNVRFKPSQVEWLGDVPEHWKIKKLKNLGSFKAGAGFPDDEQGLEDEELPFFKVGDMNLSGNEIHMVNSTNTVSKKTAKRLGAYIFKTGTIIFAKVGAALLLNRRRIITRPSCLDNNTMGFIINKAVIKYLYYWLMIIDFGRLANPGAVPSINDGQLREIVIAVPSESEQVAIAEYLERETGIIESLIQKVVEAIEKLKEYRSALINAAVTGKIDVRGYV